MKRKLTITLQRAKRLAWDQPCGCPLYEQLAKRGFMVSRVDTDDWTDIYGQKHKLYPRFNLLSYANVLRTGEPFKTETSDDD